MRRVKAWILLIGLLALAFPPGAVAEDAAAPRWIGSHGEALPFQSDEEVLAFLRQATAERVRDITSGINRHLLVRLTRDGVEAQAVFRTVDIRKSRYQTGRRVYIDFRDRYIYECAAYELGRLLGLDNIPPCVPRRLWARHGSLQLWIEGAMTEEERIKKALKAPSSLGWVRQNQTMRLFDALIRNLDRNQGNILVDGNWKLWLIDHGRTFHKSKEIERIDRLIWCERGLWEKLKGLDREQIDKHLGGYLEKEEIKLLFRRHDQIVRHFEERIAEFGEDIVLYSLDKPPPEGIESRPDFPLVVRSSEEIPPPPAVGESSGGGRGRRPSKP